MQKKSGKKNGIKQVTMEEELKIAQFIVSVIYRKGSMRVI